MIIIFNFQATIVITIKGFTFIKIIRFYFLIYYYLMINFIIFIIVIIRIFS